MTEIIGVRFKKACKVYYFSPENIVFTKGDHVIVETMRGMEYGEVAFGNMIVEDEKLVAPLKPVIRRATREDDNKVTENERKQEEAFKICQKKIKQHNLGMHLISSEYTFDQTKLIFCFTADERVDFRNLVKDLASIFHTRIELRQVGVRDEARMSGGLGICGRSLCCATFLDDFEPVSINMAKEQNLSLNPTKISGTCGRLMCCLKYEQAAYEQMISECPTVNSIVTTPEGNGIVVNVNLFKEKCLVKLGNDAEMIKEFKCNQCSMVKRSIARTGKEGGNDRKDKFPKKENKETDDKKS